jgi:hypothetical protein
VISNAIDGASNGSRSQQPLGLVRDNVSTRPQRGIVAEDGSDDELDTTS